MERETGIEPASGPDGSGYRVASRQARILPTFDPYCSDGQSIHRQYLGCPREYVTWLSLYELHCRYSAS